MFRKVEGEKKDPQQSALTQISIYWANTHQFTQNYFTKCYFVTLYYLSLIISS